MATELPLSEQLEYYASRLERVEAVLGRYWALQMGLVALSAYGLSEGWEVLGDAASSHLGLRLLPRVSSLVLAVLLLYVFVRLGFLLSQFLNARGQCDLAWKSLVPSQQTGPFISTNFFEPLYKGAGLKGWGWPLMLAVWSVAGTVFGAANGFTVLLILLATPGAWGLGVASFSAVVIVACYVLFWRNKSTCFHPCIGVVMVVAILVALTTVLVGLRLRPDAPSGLSPRLEERLLPARARLALARLHLARARSESLRADIAAAPLGSEADAPRALLELLQQELTRAREDWLAIEGEIRGRSATEDVIGWLQQTLGEDANGIKVRVTEDLGWVR